MSYLTRRLEQKANSQVWLPWVVSLSGGLLFFYEFIQLNIINSISQDLLDSFHISKAQLGNVASMYFWANALFLFLAGNLLDRFSPKHLILLALSMCTLGTFGFAIAPTPLVAGISRFIVGIGGSFCLLSAVRLASFWFSPKRLALVVGLVITMAFIGGLVAQTPATYLAQHMGWRNMMLLNGLLGVVIIIWVFFIIQNRPSGQQHLADQHKARIKALGLWYSIKHVLLNKQNWLAGIYTSLVNLPIYILGGSWGKMYLVKMNGLSENNASAVCSMLFIGALIGSPVVGLISDRLQNRRYPMMVGTLLSLFLALFILYCPNLHYMALMLMFLGLGFITCTQVISYPLVSEHNPTILTSTAVSIVSILCLLGGALGIPFVGWLMQILDSYRQAMLVMPIGFIISFVLAILIKETHCRHQHD